MPSLATVLAALPGIGAVLLRVSQALQQRSSLERTKQALQLIKLKYEIEALRVKNKLDLPKITVDAEEIGRVQTLELPWSQPRRPRSGFWVRYVRTAKKGYVTTAFVGIGALAVTCLAGSIATFSSIQFDEPLNGDSLILLLVLFLDLGAACFLTRSAVDLYRAIRFVEAQGTDSETTE